MPEGHFTEIALVGTYEDAHLNKVTDSFRITPSIGAVWYTDLDFGYPEVRDSVLNLPGASGTFDETKYHGGRSVAMSLVIVENAFNGIPAASGWDSSVNWESANYWLSRLGSWMLPEQRYALYFRRNGQDPRWMDVRPSGMSAPVVMDQRESVAVQLQWKNPSGRMYSWNDSYDINATVQTATRDGRNRKDIKPVDSDLPGRAYPEAAPYVRDYPPRPQGTDSVLYQGTAPSGFIANLHAKGSSLVNPRIDVYRPNETLAGSIGLTYTVAAGDFIHIDSTEKTITLNGIPANKLNQYLTAPTIWPVLNPGRYPLASTNTAQLSGYNRIDFQAPTFDAAAYCEVQWYDAYIY